jgi:hypothetical protein
MRVEGWFGQDIAVIALIHQIHTCFSSRMGCTVVCSMRCTRGVIHVEREKEIHEEREKK